MNETKTNRPTDRLCTPAECRRIYRRAALHRIARCALEGVAFLAITGASFALCLFILENV